MADNWWDSVSASSSAARSCMDSVSSVSGNSSSINNLFLDSTHKLLPADHDHSSTTTTTTADGSSGTGILASDPSLQMMGLGLSSQVSLDWNQTLFRGDHQNRETNFRPMIQEDHLSSSTSTNFQHESGMSISSQDQWRSQKVYKYCGNSEDSSINHRGFSLDHQPVHVQQQQYGDHHSSSSVITCQGLPCSFQMDMNSYGTPASNMFQSLLSSENQPQPQPQVQQPNYNSYNPSSYGNMNSSAGDQLSSSSWSKFPQFLRNSSPPKVQQQQQPPANNQLHFTNNAPFWNATAAPMNDSRSNFFPSLQMQLPPSSNFDDKPLKQTTSEGVKKSSSESSNKRPRNDNPPSLPAFKVRKEKMGDRITALQQLVSPFGKTDTASVLSEAIEYIKFLHEQVSILSTPYMKNGAPVVQHQQMLDKSSEGPKPDLRSRGLCLVPVSSTFPVTHETPVDFWTPSFGGTFR